jgi:hypothetical protein
LEPRLSLGREEGGEGEDALEGLEPPFLQKVTHELPALLVPDPFLGAIDAPFLVHHPEAIEAVLPHLGHHLLGVVDPLALQGVDLPPQDPA